MPDRATDIVLETERLILRRYRRDDAAALAGILSDPVTMAFWPAPFDTAAVGEWIERSLVSYAANGFGRWAILDRDSDEIIGDCGIVAAEMAGRSLFDLGYILHHTRWGRGLAVEAAAAVMNHGFATLGLPALHANMAEDHHGSRRVAERLGMSHIDTFINPRNRNKRTLLYARNP